jgi:hypothetical protein
VRNYFLQRRAKGLDAGHRFGADPINRIVGRGHAHFALGMAKEWHITCSNSGFKTVQSV